MGAYEIPGFAYSLMSEGDILQYAAVVVNSSGTVEAAGSGVEIDGVAQMPADDGDSEAIRIMKTGITVGLANEDIAAGDNVKVSATTGRFETYLAEDYGTDICVGRAITAAGAAGEYFTLLLY